LWRTAKRSESDPYVVDVSATRRSQRPFFANSAVKTLSPLSALRTAAEHAKKITKPRQTHRKLPLHQIPCYHHLRLVNNSFMAIAGQYSVETDSHPIPSTMQAAVYRGINEVRLESVPVPSIGPKEMLLRVHSCGVCGTDLKKISTGSHSAPRIFGHETSGVVAAVGAEATKYRPGDRVMVFHHIPCRECFYCQNKTFAQCSTYKKVGCTAGFEPSGGGFAEYVRVMDWIVDRGTVRVPDNISFEQACFVEPVNRPGPHRHHPECPGETGGRHLNYFRFVSREA
jgi:alcohol dehydrogenase-like protein